MWNFEATILFVDFSKAFDSIHWVKMEQILLTYGLPKETVAAIVMLYRNTKVKVRCLDGNTDYFDIVDISDDDVSINLVVISNWGRPFLFGAGARKCIYTILGQAKGTARVHIATRFHVVLNSGLASDCQSGQAEKSHNTCCSDVM